MAIWERGICFVSPTLKYLSVFSLTQTVYPSIKSDVSHMIFFCLDNFGIFLYLYWWNMYGICLLLTLYLQLFYIKLLSFVIYQLQYSPYYLAIWLGITVLIVNKKKTLIFTASMYGSYIRPGHALPRVNFIHTSRGNTDGQSDRQMNTAKTTQLDMFIIYIYIIWYQTLPSEFYKNFGKL